VSHENLHPGAGASQRWWRKTLIVVCLVEIVLGEISGLPASSRRVQQIPDTWGDRKAADRIMHLDYKQFAALRSSPARPEGYRWDTDGCTPDWSPKYFTRACYLHDFGYRNYGSARKQAPHLGPTQATKDWIDKRFHEEMYNICNDEARTDKGRGACKYKADKLYVHVKKGRKAFFGPYSS
jgi:hypothetical protein